MAQRVGAEAHGQRVERREGGGASDVGMVPRSGGFLSRTVDPAVLRLIQMAITAADRKQIPVNVCGQMSGNVAYTIVTAAASSADANYSGLNAADVTVTNNDNDTAGITVTPTSGLVTTEAGGTATFTVKLTDFNEA